MKLTKTQIEIIRMNTPAGLKGMQVRSWSGNTLGTFQPAGANWRYVATYIDYNGVPVLVVTKFGHIM